MGAYLMYKLVDPKEAIKANNFLELQQEQQELKKSHRSLWFWDSRDRLIELKKLKETGCGCPDYKKIGEGDFKASGMGCDESEIAFELVTKLFEKLHPNFKLKIYSGSCALSGDYFTLEQMRRITKNGELLSGDRKEKVLEVMNNKLLVEAV